MASPVTTATGDYGNTVAVVTAHGNPIAMQSGVSGGVCVGSTPTIPPRGHRTVTSMGPALF